jgi:8-oxo-dGTP diphosphatase
VAVSVVVFCGEEVLLIKRGKEPSKGEYSLPGGGQKLGETTHHAARREVLEETGLTVSGLQFVEMIDNIILDQEEKIQFHYVILSFVTEINPQIKLQTKANSDADEVIWVLLAEAVQLPLTEGLFDVLQKAKQMLDNG